MMNNSRFCLLSYWGHIIKLKPQSRLPICRPLLSTSNNALLEFSLLQAVNDGSPAIMSDLCKADMYWFSVNWKKPWCELRNGRVGFDG